ncbi:MAG: protein kinase domain-containing protein [Fusobacteriaceae bacterium]
MEKKQLDSTLLSEGKLYDVYLIKENSNCKILKQISSNLLGEKLKVERAENQLFMEAKILKLLKLKNIPLILEQKKEYLIFQYISGVTLKVYNKEYGLTLNKVHSLIYQLLVTLRKIHKRDIIHCDIKPENIIIESDSNKKKLCLIDFGSATLSHELSGVRQLTPKYSPKELYFIEKYKNKSTDIYSVFKLIEYMLETNKLKLDTSLIEFMKKGKEENMKNRYQSIEEILKEWGEIRRRKN